MAKAAAKKVAANQCPKCRRRVEDAIFCPKCGCKLGHTGKPGRPAKKDKNVPVWTTIPPSAHKQMTEYLDEGETESAFFRAAIERELKVRIRRHGG